MKFKLVYDNEDESRDIEVNSIEELRDLPERFDRPHGYCWEPPHRLVIDFEEMEIMVYDHYLE